jgi:uncharacterized damage-inducible protein DinB
MPSPSNPYAANLGGAAPEKVIAETLQRLADLAERLEPKGWNQSYAPGKWTARQILCHLADTELAFAFRLRQALAEPHHVIQPFDQDRWAEAYADESYDARAALQVFSSVRRWNLNLLKAVPVEARSKPVRHPERGEMTFQTLVETMGGHDVNHLRQLDSIANALAS